MAALDKIATPPEAQFTEEERRFLISSRAEIAHLLQNTVRKAPPVKAYFSPDEFARISFLAVEPDLDRLVFGLPPEPGLTARITSSQGITFVTEQDGITIKFHVDGADTTAHDGRPALVSPLPSALVRLQRREYFRVTCPPASPVKCVIPFTTMQGKAQKAEIMVINLSLGGVTLTNEHPGLNLDVGNVYKNCVLSLPDVGSFTTAIEVRNSYQVAIEDGTVRRHSGCRFNNPPPDGLTKVQRFTMMLERRNAKADRS